MVGRVERQPPTADPLPAGTPVAKSQKKIGRPTKAVAEAKAQTAAEVADAEHAAKLERDAAEAAPLIEHFLNVVFGIVAARKGDHWALDAKEAKDLSLAAARVAAKYEPDWLKKYREEIALGSIALVTLVPRWTKDKEIAKQRARSHGPSGVRQDSPAQDDSKPAA